MTTKHRVERCLLLLATLLASCVSHEIEGVKQRPAGSLSLASYAGNYRIRPEEFGDFVWWSRLGTAVLEAGGDKFPGYTFSLRPVGQDLELRLFRNGQPAGMKVLRGSRDFVLTRGIVVFPTEPDPNPFITVGNSSRHNSIFINNAGDLVVREDSHSAGLWFGISPQSDSTEKYVTFPRIR